MIHKQKINVCDKFPSLLEYLKIERAALEYGLSEIRSHSDRKYGNVSNIEKFDNGSETCLLHMNTDHTTSDCKLYLKMSVSERYETLKKRAACFNCLIPNHRSDQCFSKKECGSGCNRFHHWALHTTEHGGYSRTLISDLPDGDKTVILPIMKIKTNTRKNDYINVLWDTAENLSLITTKRAKAMNLRGKPVKLSVIVAGGEKYIVPMVNVSGCVRHIFAYGIDKVTNDISIIDKENLTRIFPDILLEQVARPSGEVDVLIGYDYAGWHPTKKQCCDHLLLLHNQFGKCFGGSHPHLKENTQRFINVSCLLHL